jgi:hypothetical protein
LTAEFIRKAAYTAIALLSFVQASIGIDRLAPNARADKVIVLKQQHLLVLLENGRVLKTYHLALGGDPKGPKQREGDHALRRVFMFLIVGMITAAFIAPFISPIPMRRIGGMLLR